MSAKAVLKCLWSDEAPDLSLLPGEEMEIGRNRTTMITDTKCPRQRLLVQFDEDEAVVKVQRTGGRRPFEVNGEPVEENATLMDGDVLNVMPGGCGYKVEILTEKEDETEDKCQWDFGWTEADDLLVYRTDDDLSSAKVAGFDMDGTLITTNSGKVFPVDEHDWKVAMAEIPKKLKQLRADGYRVVIFTNQKALSSGRQKPNVFRGKIERVMRQLGSVSVCMVSPTPGFNRKPLTGMWEQLERCSGDVSVDRTQSFYVGDAAGRYQSSGAGAAKRARKDHSCCDRLFALNLGVKFMTPEEFFQGQPPMPFHLPDFDPSSAPASALLDPENASLTPMKGRELIVLVGYPASGKSHFAQKHLNAYSYVNRDTLKTWQKCVAVTGQQLKEGRSVVVDNTNPDKESRSRYIEQAKSNGARARCFLMNCGYDQARHNNKYRQLLGVDKAHDQVNDMVINTYRSKFQEPTLDEGFEQIIKVNFQPNFADKRSEKLYKMYLLEK